MTKFKERKNSIMNDAKSTDKQLGKINLDSHLISFIKINFKQIKTLNDIDWNTNILPCNLPKNVNRGFIEKEIKIVLKHEKCSTSLIFKEI